MTTQNLYDIPADAPTKKRCGDNATCMTTPVAFSAAIP